MLLIGYFKNVVCLIFFASDDVKNWVSSFTGLCWCCWLAIL